MHFFDQMNNYSVKPLPFPTPQFYVFKTTTVPQPSPSAPPIHGQSRLPKSITNDNRCPSRPQNPSFVQSCSSSRHKGCLVNQSTPRACPAEDPLSWFSKIDLHRTEPQPGLHRVPFFIEKKTSLCLLIPQMIFRINHQRTR